MFKITINQLREMDACQEGIENFLTAYPKGIWESDWSFDDQIAFIKSPLRKWFGWAVLNKLIPLWSMTRADLSGADLSWADLTRADLSGADLSEADLTRAKLRGADLSWAYLIGADLSGADLTRADLSGAKLREADINEYTVLTDE